MRDKIYLSPPFQSGKEKNHLKKILKSNWLAPNGEFSKLFREALRDVSNAKYITLTNSGTSSLHIALKILDVQYGDEIICPSFTFAASAFPILYQSAKPIFVDVNPKTWNICPDLLEIAIQDRVKKGKKIKAVIIVHNYGNPVDWNRISSICANYGIPIIEDAAEALGAKYNNQFVGALSDIGAFSFNANKIITTSGGGAILLNDKEKYKKALKLINQAKEPSISYYQHDEIGFNYTMSNPQAAIGLGQLESINERVQKKNKIFNYYEKELLSALNCSFQLQNNLSYSNRWLTVIRLHQLTKEKLLLIKSKMSENNIETRLSWSPLHTQKAFNSCLSYVDGTSELLFNQLLCLPSGLDLTNRQLKNIVICLKKTLSEIIS